MKKKNDKGRERESDEKDKCVGWVNVVKRSREVASSINGGELDRRNKRRE